MDKVKKEEKKEEKKVEEKKEKEESKEFGRVSAKNLPISTKQSVEICNSIRGMRLSKARNFLNLVLEKKTAVPYKRYKKDVPHRKSIAAGRYPVKATKYLLDVLKSAEANALNAGLSENLVIEKIIANKGFHQWHIGRKRRRRFKRTNVDVVLKEIQR